MLKIKMTDLETNNRRFRKWLTRVLRILGGLALLWLVFRPDSEVLAILFVVALFSRSIAQLFKPSSEIVSFFIESAIVLSVALYFISQPFVLNNWRDWEMNILISAHSLLFDIVLFGIVLSFYDDHIRKQQDIKRYLEEIDDYRYWISEEAVIRTMGSIRRLNYVNIFDLNLKECYLKKAMLKEVNLTKANLENTNLEEANLSYSLMSNANLKGSNLKNSNLKHINLNHADLSKADLSYANLDNATANNANLRRADMSYTYLNLTKLQGVDGAQANFQNAVLINPVLRGANLNKADFSGAYLIFFATIDNSNLEGIILDDAKINDPKWIDSLDRWNVRGAAYIKQHYYIDSVPEHAHGHEVYEIKRKES
ncbi:MAG: pentapeptide repeat-containing protein [Saprospiraceae bacterium]|nr:pentapeptide repeat-containing protein [Saprospiraceae bacterium]